MYRPDISAGTVENLNVYTISTGGADYEIPGTDTAKGRYFCDVRSDDAFEVYALDHALDYALDTSSRAGGSVSLVNTTAVGMD